MSSIASASSKMFSGTLVSRVLGQVRLIVLIAALGVSHQADAFQVANTLPNTIYILLAGGVLNAILVPHIVRAMARDDDDYVNRLLTLAGVLLLSVTVVMTAASSVLMTIFASQLAPEWFHLAVAFGFWCIPQVFFYGLYTLLGNVLNARGSFGPYMWAPVVNNLIAIAGLVAYIVVFGGAAAGEDPEVWTGARIAMIGAVATLGVAAQALVLIVPLRNTGFRFRLTWGFRNAGLRSASTMAAWTFVTLVVGQLSDVVYVNVAAAANGAAATAPAGGPFIPTYTAFTSAFTLYMVPHSLITTSLVTAMFTRMSARAAAADIAGVRRDFSLGLRVAGVFTMFATVAMVVLALPLVQATLPSTSADSAPGFAAVLVALSFGIPAQAVWTMVQRTYYAFSDAKTLLKLQVPVTGIVVAGGLISLLLEPRWWVVVMAAFSALSLYVGGLLGYLSLRLKLRRTDGAAQLRTYLRLLLSAVPSGLAGWLLLHWWGPLTTAGGLGGWLLAVVKLGVVGAVMAAIYLILLRALHVQELETIAAPVMARLGGLARRGSTSAPTMETAVRKRRDVEMRLAEGRFELTQLELESATGSKWWAGRDTVMDSDVWVLTVPPELTSAVLDAARRAAVVDDAHLPRTIDIGEDDGAGYVVYERRAGRSLVGLEVEDSTARALVGEAATALAAARRRGVHHGAIRPELIRVGTDDVVRVLGIGTAGLAGFGPAIPQQEEEDRIAASLARSAADARALVTLRAQLSGVAEPPDPINADAVVNALEPWEPVKLPPAAPPATPARASWLRKLRDLTGPAAATEGTVDPGGPTAAEITSDNVLAGGPAAAALDATRWGLPRIQESRAPDFDAILAADDAQTNSAPLHVASGQPIRNLARVAVDTAKEASTKAGSLAKDASDKAKELAREAKEKAENYQGLHVPGELPDPANRELPLSKRRLDPGPFVVAVVGIAVVVAVVLALMNLRGAGGDVSLAPRTDPVATTTAAPTTQAEETPSASPTTTDPTAVPEISSINVLDPEGDGEENPDLTPRAMDGDPDTYWRSRSYVNPQYGMKSGIGLDLVLEQPAMVSEVEIELHGTGGHVQVKADPSDAVDGAVIAEADMGGTTVITFPEPVEMSNVVLWFTSLPTAESDGKNRLEVIQVAVR